MHLYIQQKVQITFLIDYEIIYTINTENKSQ